MSRGTWTEVETTDWSGTVGVTALGDRIYAVNRGGLYAIAADGSYDQLGDDAWGARLLVPSGKYLVAVEPNGSMYAITVADGSYQELGGDWLGATGAAAITGAPHVVCDGAMYRVSPSDGAIDLLESSWADVAFLVSLGAADHLLAILASGAAYLVAADGTSRELATAWPGAQAVAGDDGKAYVIEGGVLYELDPLRDSHAELPTGTGWNSEHLVVMGGALYAFERGGGLFKIALR